MKNLKKTLLCPIILLSLLISEKNSNAQIISDNFFGVNAWMPDSIGSVFLNGKLHKNWPKVKGSGAAIVRFGGITPDKNRPTNSQYIKMIDSIRANGMEPILQVPFYNYRFTAQQAADIVYYINVVRGKNIKYWIIGNEPDLSYSFTTASQVANYIKPFASAMKNADPSILIIGPETAWYNQTIINGLTTPGGSSDITGRDGAGRYYIDVLSFHTYPFNGSQTRSQVVSKLTSSGSLKDNLIALNSRLAAANSYHNRTGTSALKTAITEANICYKNASTDNLYGVGANSFLGGQFVAEMMGVGLKNGLEFFNLWSVIEGNSTELNIGFLDRTTAVKKPLYYHFQLMADNFRGNYVNGTTNQVNVKSFACKDAQQVAVLILNQDQSSNYSYTVRLNTASIAGTSALKINANAGLAKEYTDVIQNQSTTLLLFDSNGNIIKKSEYKLSGNADANLPPTVTILSSITSLTSATITPSGPTSFCEGNNVILNANTGTGYTYQWKKDNIAISGAVNSSYTASVSGSYSVAITYNGVTLTSAAQSVTVMPAPVAIITAAGPTSFATGGNVILNASTGTGYTYQWKKDGIDISGAISSSYVATQAGSYQLKVILGSCPKWSAPVEVTIISTTGIIATITASGPTIFCDGGSVTLTANAGTGYTYQWKKDNIAISGAINLSYVATLSGAYSVAVSSSGVTTTSANQAVTVNPNPVAAITPAGPTSFSAGGSVILNSSTGTGYIYQWKKDGVNIVGATSSSYVATQAGSYQIKTILGSCPNWSAPLEITVLPTTTIIATITTSGSTTFCEGGSVTLNANAGTGYTYQWKKDNIVISGATNLSYTATVSGAYSVAVSSSGVTTTSAEQVVTVNPNPVATITAGGPTSFAAGDSVILNSSTGTGYIYQWKKDGVNIIVGATSSSYVAKQAGSYQIKTILGSCPNWSAPLEITVLSTTTIIATITTSGSTTFCEGGSVTLNANAGTGYTYQWKKDNIAISGAIYSYYIASVSGSYSVTVTSGDISTTSTTQVITVTPLPVALITQSGPISIVTGDSVLLNASTGTGYIYQWKKDGVYINGATNSTYVATQAGNYQIKITLGSCIDWSAPLVVTILQTTATITASGPTSFCEGGSVTLNTNAGTGYLYQWKLDNTAIAGAVNSSYTATESGNYSVDVTSGGETSTSADIMITSMLVPVATITPLEPANLCSGAVILEATTGSGYSYQWKKDNIDIAGANNYNYSALTSGAYQIEVTQGSCKSLSVIVSVQIQTELIATITPGGPTEFCIGEKVELYAGVCSDYSYQWLKNGTNIPGATSSTYIVKKTGSYQVKIVQGSFNDLSAAVYVTIDKCKAGVVYTNKDLSVDSTFLTSVESDEMVNGNIFEINVFPNPSNGKFIVEMKNISSEKKNVIIEVSNMIGQIVYRRNYNFIADSQEIILPDDIGEGIFVLTVKEGNNSISKRIVIH